MIVLNSQTCAITGGLLPCNSSPYPVVDLVNVTVIICGLSNILERLTEFILK